MKHGTKINWTHFPGYKGETWNPIVGCSHVSEGCKNCYAERWGARLAAMGKRQYRAVTKRNLDYPMGAWNGEYYCISSAHDIPYHWRKPRAIFVCSMGDLFYELIPYNAIKHTFKAMADNPRHIFLVLTKRPDVALNLYKFYNRGYTFEFPDNVWLGVTAENQQTADERIPVLLQIPCAHRFVSVEPMLGAVEIEDWLPQYDYRPTYEFQRIAHGWTDDKPIKLVDGIDWIICGGESGPNARPMLWEWPICLLDQCERADVPFFMKQMSQHDGYDRYDIPLFLDVKQFPEVK